MVTELSIDYVEFASRDMGRSRAFFEAAFGWRFTAYGPGYVGMDNAGIDGGIEQAEGEPVAPLVILYAQDLDAAEAAAVAAGAVITRPQFDFPGGRRFHFREPGGNELAVRSDGGVKAA